MTKNLNQSTDQTKLHTWQLDIIDKMVGFKPGELVTYTASRGTGKSWLNQQTLDRLMRDLMNRPLEDLVLSEGRVYGARYHCVEPVGGNWREMEDWCIQTIGETTGSIWAEQIDKKTPQPGERWYSNNRKFWFRNESDRTLFILRWR